MNYYLILICMFICVGCAQRYDPHVLAAEKVAMEFINQVKKSDL